jgi:hypothetical protein
MVFHGMSISAVVRPSALSAAKLASDQGCRCRRSRAGWTTAAWSPRRGRRRWRTRWLPAPPPVRRSAVRAVRRRPPEAGSGIRAGEPARRTGRSPARTLARQTSSEISSCPVFHEDFRRTEIRVRHRRRMQSRSKSSYRAPIRASRNPGGFGTWCFARRRPMGLFGPIPGRLGHVRQRIICEIFYTLRGRGGRLQKSTQVRAAVGVNRELKIEIFRLARAGVMPG